MKKDKSTMIKFGSRMIHKYTIKDGVDDKVIVALLYVTATFIGINLLFVV